MSGYRPSYAVAVPLALFGSLIGTVTVGPLFAPLLVLVLFLAAGVLAARGSSGPPGWKVALRWGAVGLLSGVASEVLVFVVVVLGSLIGLWPRIGAGE